MTTSEAISIGIGLLAFMGYGTALLFLAIALTALWSAFRVQQEEKGRFKDMDVFVIGTVIAFITAAITALVIRLIG